MKMSWNMFSYRWHRGLLTPQDVLMVYCPKCLTAGRIKRKNGKPCYVMECNHDTVMPEVIIKEGINLMGRPSKIQRVVDLNAQGGK